MASTGRQPDTERLDKIVAEARRNRAQRETSYRERALSLYPWICGRCAREFDRTNLVQLTVHHRDHNHDNNPPDGSNWELLCVYCHDNEHSRQRDNAGRSASAGGNEGAGQVTHKPFAGLAGLLTRKDSSSKP